MDLVKGVWLSLLTGLVLQSCRGYVRVCYYTNWSQFNQPPYDLTPDRIPADLCTHIVFAFADIRGPNLLPTEFNDVELYGQLNRLRKDNPSLRLLLAIGGWAAGGSKFSNLVSNQKAMMQFANNLVRYLRRYSFDGANIDWQYPTIQDRGSDVVDRSLFTKLLENIRTVFDDEFNISAKSRRLSLSVMVEANITEARTFYETKRLGSFVDFAFLMAYDFHGAWDLTTGALHHSALFPDISDFVNGWLGDRMPAEKMVLGVAGFGRSFTLAEQPSGNGLGQAVTAGGVPGDISGTDALLEYGEICRNVRDSEWRRIWIDDQGVPVAFGNTSRNGNGWQWVGYDDPKSLREKAWFIRENGLAGVMFWSLSCDDFTNVCGQGTWPLLKTLAKELPQDDDGNSRSRLKGSTSSPKTNAINDTTPHTHLLPKSPNGNKMPEIFPNKPKNPMENRTSSTSTTKTKLSTFPNPNDERKKEEDSFTFTPTNIPIGEFDFSLEIPQILKDSLQDNHHRNSLTTTTSGHPAGSETRCKISSNAGPSLTCSPTKGKQGDRKSFYLLCVPGFLAVECRCLRGYFFNRCLSVCDKDENFKTCPIVH